MAMLQVSDSSDVLLPEPHELAKHGISLVINNKTEEAENLFKSNLDSIQMTAGFAFVSFMDALMSFEEDKLEIALNILRDTEKKCAADIGWLRSVKNKVCRSKPPSLADRLEKQIILADTQVCIALLTFLQQEFSGYLKGGWGLKKAWKIYEYSYTEITEIYKQKFGTFNLPEPTDFNWTDTCLVTKSRSVGTAALDDWEVPDPITSGPKINPQNGYVPISSPDRKSNIPHSQSSYFFSKTSNFFSFSLKRSDSAHSSLTENNTKNNNKSVFSLLSPLTTHLSFLTNSLNLLTSANNNVLEDIDSETITRLMGAVCFGYGGLQLVTSFLPSSLLKVTNFLGFNSNRTAGVSNLMYARKGTDMRAPLATLSLLWYHTIIRQYYALDGTNIKLGLEAANLLIQESQPEYEESALFLYFKGRIQRIDGNITLALESFQAAVNNSTQREVKLLALHEVGWCYLLQLDYTKAQKVFLKLRYASRWSKPYYLNLSIICSGSFGRREFSEIEELRGMYQNNNKTNQMNFYIQRRLKLYPFTNEDFINASDMYWKFLVYELIYLWYALPNCSTVCLEGIIQDCNESSYEAMPGLAKLIQGECYSILGFYLNAVESLRECLLIRSSVTPNNDIHISAFAEYTLGALLIQNPETKEEGKKMLLNSQNYKDYDFENKLQDRINMALKKCFSPN